MGKLCDLDDGPGAVGSFVGIDMFGEADALSQLRHDRILLRLGRERAPRLGYSRHHEISKIPQRCGILLTVVSRVNRFKLVCAAGAQPVIGMPVIVENLWEPASWESVQFIPVSSQTHLYAIGIL